jgi:formate hydrogenlyase subunit 3/multisubunit Na+/H+ antiporter MnhD subunit
LHIARGEHTPLLVEDLNGASRRYPWAAFTFSIAVLGLGGLPPLAGFMSKWQIFTAGFSIDNVSQNSTVSTLVLLIFIFMALNSVLSLAYYAPLVNRLYRREPSAIVLTGKRLSWTMQLPLMILAAAIVVLGCWPSLLDWLTGPAASSLMASFGI